MDSYIDFLADYANLNIRNIDEIEYDRIKTMAYKVCDYLTDSMLISGNVRNECALFAFDYIVKHDGIRGMRKEGALELLIKNTRENGILIEKQINEENKRIETEKRKIEVNNARNNTISIQEYISRKLNRFYKTGVLKKDVNLDELIQSVTDIFLDSDVTSKDVVSGMYDKNLALILANGNNLSDDFYKIKVNTFENNSKAEQYMIRAYNDSEEREMRKNEITALLIENGVNMSNIDRNKCDAVVSNYLDREYNRYESIKKQNEKREKAIRKSEHSSKEEKIKRILIALAAIGYLTVMGGKAYNAYQEKQEEDRLRKVREYKTHQSISKSNYHNSGSSNNFYDYDNNEFVMGDGNGRSV